mmetsp:Transcript_28085/g.56278  ORF Transcript_28085/g.56278 Transcript_28085/m.56278 type:complete len:229 (+) Transcript_28085:382-1068(+)
MGGRPSPSRSVCGGGGRGRRPSLSVTLGGAIADHGIAVHREVPEELVSVPAQAPAALPLEIVAVEVQGREILELSERLRHLPVELVVPQRHHLEQGQLPDIVVDRPHEGVVVEVEPFERGQAVDVGQGARQGVVVEVQPLEMFELVDGLRDGPPDEVLVEAQPLETREPANLVGQAPAQVLVLHHDRLDAPPHPVARDAGPRAGVHVVVALQLLHFGREGEDVHRVHI